MPRRNRISGILQRVFIVIMCQVQLFLWKSNCSIIIFFQPNEKTVILEDIHECLEFGSSLCKNGRCSNTFGSYMCMCKIGFELDKNGVSSKQFRMSWDIIHLIFIIFTAFNSS